MELQRKEEEKKQFKSGVAKFYDEFSGQWEHIYESDHIHHGFYDPNSTKPVDHHSARIRMLEEAIRFANISEDPSRRPKSIIDVGCGIGGTSRYLAKKYGASCVGITLSPVQAERANTLAAAQGLTDEFVAELARVAAPGATIVIVTWCHRDLNPNEESLQKWEDDLLKKISDAYYLPK